MSEKAAPESKNAIPKIIHYIWVGENPFPASATACLASWRRLLPEYEFKLWNEANSPMEHHYVKAMYAQKKWAFVSDYIRFWALSRDGGIYLDTDMELFKNLDPFLTNVPGFVGCSKSGQIESSIIGSVPGAAFVTEAIRFYDEDRKYTIAETSPLVLERAMRVASAPAVVCYPHTYFHPCDEGEIGDPVLLKEAYARHHWAESWVPFASLRKVARRLGIMPLLKRLLS